MYESLRYQTIDTTRRCINAATVTTFLLAAVMLPVPRVRAQSETYTTTADFDSAFLINSDGVDDEADGELAIRTVPQTLPYIWVACSLRGTVVRINTTEPRQVVGEYLTGPTRLCLKTVF